MPMVFFTPDMDEAFLEQWHQNRPLSMIAEHIGVSRTVVTRRRHELKLPKRSRAKVLRTARELYHVS